MSIWQKLSGLFTGEKGVVAELGDVVDRFVHTKEEKAKLKLTLLELEHKRILEAQRIALEADAEFNQRIKDLEGTGTDLLQAGWPGRVVLFLRGAQRPLWGYGVLFLNFMVYSGRYKLTDEVALLDNLWIINILVLGFLFGERAVKNVLPYIEKLKR